MYGILIESFLGYLKETYGAKVMEEIQRHANITQRSFVTHKVYSETLFPRLVSSTVHITGTPKQELMEHLGAYFVTFVAQYGYDRILKVLGRHIRDFLSNLDAFHDSLLYSYPKLKPPSFFIEDETYDGVTMHYRSKRKGFTYYVLGQIKAVVHMFYDIDISIELMSKKEQEDFTHSIFRLKFDNTAYMERGDQGAHVDRRIAALPTFKSSVFFDVFPFHIVFNQDLVIKSVGRGLNQVLADVQLHNKSVDTEFIMKKPSFEFNWNNVSIIFETYILLFLNGNISFNGFNIIQQVHSHYL